MPKTSAGILLYRRSGDAIEVLLVHPGGPLWARKDDGVWSIPKGEYENTEDPLTVARREFTEETGSVADGPFVELGSVKQSGRKVVSAWAAEGTIDAATIRSNAFTMEWPPKSGRQSEFPEVDRAAWFSLDVAKVKLVVAQRELVDRLYERLTRRGA